MVDNELDFGVSFWSVHKNVIEAPEYYVNGKAVYAVDDVKKTLQSDFNIK